MPASASPDRDRLRDHLEQRIYRIDEVRRRGRYCRLPLKLDGVTQRQGPNFRETVAQFSVLLDGELLDMMTPSKRSFSTRATTTTEAALLTRGASQLYVSLGDIAADGTVAVRIYHKPLVLLIWFGPVLMAFGGMLSLSDRRLRVGAPKPAKSLRGLQAAE
jgi:cytochrome c-type biogenesis protein CcmF